LARCAGRQLRDAGVPAGWPVCVVGPKSPELVAALLAAFRSGHRVLLPPHDLGEATLLQLCTQAGCGHLGRVGPEPGGRAGRSLRAVGGGRGVGAVRPRLMVTTSGSTGLPKVVPLSEAGVDRFIAWAAGQFGLGPGTVVLNYAPLNFDLCLLDVWASLARGA